MDVVAVYSSLPATFAASSPGAFHTERVAARRIGVGDSLILPLNTGIADWRYVGTDPGPYFENTPVVNLQPNDPLLPWQFTNVSQLPTDVVNFKGQVTKRYRLCFDLCCGFLAPPTTPLQVFADDYIDLWLNGTKFGSTGAQPDPPAVAKNILLPGNLFRVGRNCLEVAVQNIWDGGTRFALMGTLQVPRGRCCCEPLPLLKARSVAS